jgi:two-component system OmpR family response regulator
MQKTILVADDDAHIREVVQFALEKAGMTVTTANDGKQALEEFRRKKPALLVLDVTMPELDGLEVCKAIRKTDDTPILFLSSRDEEIDRIIGIEIGGDDYLTKPFSPRELVARINAILKRTNGQTPKQNVKMLAKGNLKIEPEQHLATYSNKEVTLTAMEFDLLKTLLKRPEKVYSRDELMNDSYGNIVVSDRTIDSHVRNLRTKFASAGGDDIISTVHGVGYKLGSCV